MATKFTTLEKRKENKSTTFNSTLMGECLVDTETTPYEWDNVQHIGYDEEYGDVFKCWDDGEDLFKLYFGEKGDEFN